MRFQFLLACLIASLPHAVRAEPVEDQFATAAEVFLGSGKALPDMVQYFESYPRKIMDGLAGRWVIVAVAGSPAKPVDARASALSETRSCEADATISIRSETSFAMSDGGAANPKETVYTSIGGNLFTEYTNPDSVVDSLGLNQMKQDDPAVQFRKRSILMNARLNLNWPNMLFRPSPDILVVQRAYGMPLIFARCP